MPVLLNDKFFYLEKGKS